MGRKKGRCINKLCQQYNKERPIREDENCEYCGKNSIEIIGEIEELKGYILPERLQKIKNNLQLFKIKNEEREILSIFLQYYLGGRLHKKTIFQYLVLKYRDQKVPFHVYETLEEMAKKEIIIYENDYFVDVLESISNFLYGAIPDAFEKLITTFYYLVPVDNMPSIIENGILCRNGVIKRKISFRDVSNPEIQDVRNEIPIGGLTLHDYVNVFFAKRPPMLSNIIYGQKISQREIGYVCVNKDVLLLDRIYFSDGNARAVRKTKFYCDLKDLEKISWECFDSDTEYNKDDDNYRKKQAEVLVPYRISPDKFQRIVVYDEKTIEDIKEKIQTAAPIVVDKSFYF